MVSRLVLALPFFVAATPGTQSAPHPARVIDFDQRVSIPTMRRGAGSTGPQNAPPNFVGNMEPYDRAGLALGWTPIGDGDDGQLLADVSAIRLWRKVERSALFQYIPARRTVDENRNKVVLYELVNDSFKCSARTAVKVGLEVKYQDGTWQRYFPWGYAALEDIWVPVMPGTALDREMSFVCGVQLASDPANTVSRGDADRLFGTWLLGADTQGRISGQIRVARDTISFTADGGKQPCSVRYHLTTLVTGSTYPGAQFSGNRLDNRYSTFVMELGEHHCALGIAAITVTLSSDERDVAHFAAFFGPVQAAGTMRRVAPGP
jgi:hypothetical protein